MRGYGWSVDTDGFDAAMAEQKAAARRAWSGSGDAATETIWLDLGERLGSTEFLGYGAESAEGQVTALVIDGAEVETASGQVAVVTNQTPFYAESGGQQGDKGTISWDGGSARVTDTFKTPAGMFVHRAEVAEGELSVGTALRMDIDGVSAAAGSAPTIRRRTFFTRRFAMSLATMWRRRARLSRPTGFVSISRTRAPFRPRS